MQTVLTQVEMCLNEGYGPHFGDFETNYMPSLVESFQSLKTGRNVLGGRQVVLGMPSFAVPRCLQNTKRLGKCRAGDHRERRQTMSRPSFHLFQKNTRSKIAFEKR